jgi:hypothetical protein
MSDLTIGAAAVPALCVRETRLCQAEALYQELLRRAEAHDRRGQKLFEALSCRSDLAYPTCVEPGLYVRIMRENMGTARFIALVRLGQMNWLYGSLQRQAYGRFLGQKLYPNAVCEIGCAAAHLERQAAIAFASALELRDFVDSGYVRQIEQILPILRECATTTERDCGCDIGILHRNM